MKRNHNSEDSYSESSEEIDTSSSNDDDEEEIVVNSDTEIDYNTDIVVIFPGLNNLPNKKDKSKSKSKNHRRKKTKLEKTREETLKQIQKLHIVDDSLQDQILDSNFSLQIKAKLLADLDSISDKDKIKNYIKRVLKIPCTNKIPKNEDNLILELRKNLDESVYGHNSTKEEIVDFITGKMSNPEGYKSQILALHGPPGIGKCHAKDTEILMFNGDCKLVQDIKIGDTLMGDDSTPRKVLSLGKGKDVMYKITHSVTKRSYTVNSEHILCLISDKKDVVEITVKQYLNLKRYIENDYKGYSIYIEFPHISLYNQPEFIVEHFIDDIEYLPFYCKLNSLSVRVRVLIALMKKFGVQKDGNFILHLKNKTFINDVSSLCYSIGISCSSYENGIIIYHTIEQIKPRLCIEDITITKLQEDDYYGFTLDGNSRYVLNNYIVTHNTRFIRSLGKTLDLPFTQISFGGLNDIAVLIGHDYTYIGSKPGKIYDALVKSKCKNCIIYLDEIDKIASSDSEKYIAINGLLTHLLDPEQNKEFHDNYLGEISLDLSNVFFIVSFNNDYNIDPIVLNRLKVINIEESSLKDKIQIVKLFSIPEICKNLSLDNEMFSIEDSVISYIITSKTKKDKGMRSINQNLGTLFSRINTMNTLTKFPEEARQQVVKNFSYENVNITDYTVNGKININRKLVDIILNVKQSYAEHMMYI